MNKKIYIAIVVVTTLVALTILFFDVGTENMDNTPHKCSTSTNIKDLFCKRGE